MTTSHKMLAMFIFILLCSPAAVTAQTQDTAVDAAQAEAAQADAIPLTPALEKRARALNEQLRCPVCQSSSIEESPAFEATEMKSVVRTMLAEGKSDEEIVGYFQSRYGDWVMLAPPKRGFNLMVYILPVLLVVGGAVFVYRTARRYVATPG